jgi:hypothetical protein
MRHPFQPIRHTRHPLDDLGGTAQAITDDASSRPDDTSDDASTRVSPQVMTLMTLVTLSLPFHHHAHARTRTGRHTELRVTSVIRHPKRHRSPL